MAKRIKRMPNLIANDLNALIESGPDGMSEFFVLIQGPLRNAVKFIEKYSDEMHERADNYSQECSECGQERTLTADEREAKRAITDKLMDLDEWSREVETSIDVYAEFDPDWMKGEDA